VNTAVCTYILGLLVSPSVTRLQHLLHKCEVELAWLDMSINFSKSSCLRIGPRNHVVCATITSSTGHSIPWTSEIRYLRVYLVKFRTVKCSLDAAKRGFYREFNSIFGKIGHIASEDHSSQWKTVRELLHIDNQRAEMQPEEARRLCVQFSRFFANKLLRIAGQIKAIGCLPYRVAPPLHNGRYLFRH